MNKLRGNSWEATAKRQHQYGPIYHGTNISWFPHFMKYYLPCGKDFRKWIDWVHKMRHSKNELIIRIHFPLPINHGLPLCSSSWNYEQYYRPTTSPWQIGAPSGFIFYLLNNNVLIAAQVSRYFSNIIPPCITLKTLLVIFIVEYEIVSSLLLHILISSALIHCTSLRVFEMVLLSMTFLLLMIIQSGLRKRWMQKPGWLVFYSCSFFK